MSNYRVSTVTESQVVSDSTTASLKLSPVSFSRVNINSKSYEVFPVLITSRLAEDTQETWALDNYYQTANQWLRLLIVKSTRPVKITIDGVNFNPKSSFSWSTAPLTYYQQVFDSLELDLGYLPTSLTIRNFPAPLTSPSPLPFSYPAAQVEVMLAVQEDVSSI